MLFLASVTWAQDGPGVTEAPVDPSETELFDDIGEIVEVKQQDGTPRVAGSAHQIGQEQLETDEYDDIGRILGNTPGIYVRTEDGFGLRPNIGLRGANSDRSAKVTVMEDGIPLVPAPYAAPAAYYFPMPTRMVEVEVFKGAAATQHGPQTIGGAVNLKTRAVPTRTDGGLDLAYGVRNTAKLHGWGAIANERAGVLLEASHLQTDGFKRLDSGGPTGFDRTDVMLKGRYTHDGGGLDQQLVLKLGYGNETSHETYLGLHPDDYAEAPLRRYEASSAGLMQWHRTQAELAWTVRAPGVQVHTVAYHHYVDRAWTKLNRFADGPSLHTLLQQPAGGVNTRWLDLLRGDADSIEPEETLQIGTNDRTFYAFGVQSTGRWTAGGRLSDKLSWGNRLELGVRAHADRVERIATEQPHTILGGRLTRSIDPASLLSHNQATATALAAHVHDDLRLGGLHFLPGARMEVIRTTFVADASPGAAPDPEDPGPQTRTVLLPGVAVLQELGRNGLVFAGAHRGFSPVAPGQAPEVRPELSWNYEAGGRYANGAVNGELVGFVNDYANLTGQCTLSGGCTDDQLGQQFNGGKVRVYGLEAVAGWTVNLPGRLALETTGTYTLTISSFRTGFVSGFPQFGTVEKGDSLPYVPVHQGSAKLGLTHRRFGGSVKVQARSGMRDAAGSGPLTDLDVPGRALVDLAAWAQLDRHLRVYSTLTNVGNSQALESWRPFGARPTAPRQLMVGLKLTGL